MHRLLGKLSGWSLEFLYGVSRSNFYRHLAVLVECEVISMDDLKDFSDETREIIERMAS